MAGICSRANKRCYGSLADQSSQESRALTMYAAGLVVAALLEVGYAVWAPACCCIMQVLSKLASLLASVALQRYQAC